MRAGGMNMEPIRWLQPTALLALSLYGCSNLADEDSVPPAIGSLQGELILAEGVQAPIGEMKLALLWDDWAADFADEPRPTCEGTASMRSLRTQHLVAQPLELQPMFPARFTLDLTAP